MKNAFIMVMYCTMVAMACGAEYKPRLYGPQAGMTREAFEARLDEVFVHHSSDYTLTVPETDEKGGDYRKPVFSGRAFLWEINEGYYPGAMSFHDRMLACSFMSEIYPAVLVMESGVSANSHLADIRMDQLTPKDIPALVNNFREEGSGVGLSFYDECTNYVITGSSESHLEWERIDYYEGSGDPYIWWYKLRLLAWGDFNADGFEDMICEFNMSFRTGRNVDCYTVVLTRRTSNGPLEYLGEGEQFIKPILESGRIRLE